MPLRQVLASTQSEEYRLSSHVTANFGSGEGRSSSFRFGVGRLVGNRAWCGAPRRESRLVWGGRQENGLVWGVSSGIALGVGKLVEIELDAAISAGFRLDEAADATRSPILTKGRHTKPDSHQGPPHEALFSPSRRESRLVWDAPRRWRPSRQRDAASKPRPHQVIRSSCECAPATSRRPCR